MPSKMTMRRSGKNSRTTSGFVQDASYHAIRLNRDKSLVVEDLDMACRNSILVEARPTGDRQAVKQHDDWLGA